MTNDERLAALDRAVAIHAPIYGIEKPRVKLKVLGKDIDGQYDQTTNTISMNPESFGVFPRIAETSFEEVIHEAIHAYQWKLINDYWSGRLKPGDPRFRQAELFTLNRGQLHFSPPSHLFEYKRQPVEVHSRDVGKQVFWSLRRLRR